MLSDELEHCALWPELKKPLQLNRQLGDTNRWFSSVKMYQPVSWMAETFLCLLLVQRELLSVAGDQADERLDQNNYQKDAKALCKAEGNCRVGDNVGVLRGTTRFRLHIGI